MTDNIPDISKSAAYALSEIAKEGYQDLAKPGAQNIGKTIGSGTRLLYAIFGRPLDSVSKKIENFFDSVDEGVRNKAKCIPPSERIEPSLGFTKAVYDGILSAESNKTLEELFVNLITSSMDKRYANGLLLVYPDILKQLTSDEAKILLTIYKEKGYGIPTIDIVSTNKSPEKGQITVLEKFSILLTKKYSYPSNFYQYIDNLARLRLIEIDMLRQYSDETKYNAIVNNNIISEYKEKIEKGQNCTMEIKKGIIKLTKLGIGFCKACKISEISQFF